MLETWLIALQILIQFAASFFSYSIYQRHRNYGPWLALTIAFALMAFRRVATLLFEMGIEMDYAATVSYLDRIILPLVTSALLFYALFSIKSEFDASFSSQEKAFAKIEKAIKRGMRGKSR
jgi:hypothetical protein